LRRTLYQSLLLLLLMQKVLLSQQSNFVGSVRGTEVRNFVMEIFMKIHRILGVLPLLKFTSFP